MYILPSPTHQNEPFYFWCRDRIFIWNRKRMLFIGFPKGYKLKRSGTILTYSYPGKIANLTYADYLCVVSYILVNVVSTWALTVTTHRHTQVKPLFTYFHQYNLSWWKNGQKNKGLSPSNFGLSFEKVVPTTYLCWILIEEFLFYQSIDYYCLTRLSSMCFFSIDQAYLVGDKPNY